MVDFSRLNRKSAPKRPLDPIEVFEALPNLPQTPNDLWRGQTDALKEWAAHREDPDILVSLNTGAGKTLVGILVAQSLVNEGVENVIYACATIDLVHQTSQQASDIGIEHTTRVGRQFDNDLFESGQAFCITTYHAIFNGLSAIQRKHFPGAVIFDDAHVAEGILRNCMTLRVSGSDNPALFRDIVELFLPSFEKLGIPRRFEDSLTGENDSMVMVPPTETRSRESQLSEILERHDVGENGELKYAYAHLKDRLRCCSLIFGNGIVEAAPPFLPSLALDIFSQDVRRIYLSATLRHKTDLVRAFGRLPTTIIEPRNDAGNGERLFLFGREIENGISEALVREITQSKKAVIAVPNYNQARRWQRIAAAPSRENFSEELQQFRESESGAFVLVSRVDGIDLPHDICRIMIVDGLPSGLAYIERFQAEFLKMGNFHSTKLANRLVQLFGRINRGRNDFGIFLISGRDLSTWLRNDRNVALLPELLQRQILLSRGILDNLGAEGDAGVQDVMDAVLSRNSDWLEYYQAHIQSDQIEESTLRRVDDSEDAHLRAASLEAEYAASIWADDLPAARERIQKSSEGVSAADSRLSGWHYIWLADVLYAEGDLGAASLAYDNARARLNASIVLPRIRDRVDEDESQLNPFGERLFELVALTDAASFEAENASLRSSLDLASLDSNTTEDAVRALGSLLGFTSWRPDNDTSSGPDVIWEDLSNKLCLPIELKTKKQVPACYFKKEIGQAHNHLSWVEEHYPDYDWPGLLIVGPDGSVEEKASPSDEMWHCEIESFVALRDHILALISDLRQRIPLERRPAIEAEANQDQWALEHIFGRLAGTRLTEMPRIQR